VVRMGWIHPRLPILPASPNQGISPSTLANGAGLADAGTRAARLPQRQRLPAWLDHDLASGRCPAPGHRQRTWRHPLQPGCAVRGGGPAAGAGRTVAWGRGASKPKFAPLSPAAPAAPSACHPWAPGSFRRHCGGGFGSVRWIPAEQDRHHEKNGLPAAGPGPGKSGECRLTTVPHGCRCDRSGPVAPE